MVESNVKDFQNDHWYEFYPDGIPQESNVTRYQSLADLLEKLTTHYTHRTAFTHYGSEMTFAELDKAAKAFAASLQSRGFKKGDKLAIILPNCMQFPVAVIGGLYAGLTIVPMNPLYGPTELEHQLVSVDCDAAVVINFATKKLKEVFNKTKLRKVIVTELGDMFWLVKRCFVNYKAKQKFAKEIICAKELGFFNDIEISDTFLNVLSEGRTKSFEPVEIAAQDVAFIEFTGGTTGLPKGAMQSHAGVLAAVEQLTDWLSLHLEEEYTAITCLPLYHVFALVVNMLGCIRLGARNVLITNPKDPKEIITAFRHYPIAAMSGVEALYKALLQNPEFKKLDFSSLKLAVAGATAVHTETAAEFRRLTDTVLLQGYALTQCMPVSMALISDQHFRQDIGLPLPSTKVKLVDEAGQVIRQPNSPGELCVKGPQMMMGYYNNPKATAKEIRDGWLHTGDIASWTEDGRLRFEGRNTDMIDPGGNGFNVYPDEVEKIIGKHARVLDVACFGVKFEGLEQTKVVVLTDDKTLTKDMIYQYCKDIQMAGYKRPMFVEIMLTRDEFFVSHIGKTQRNKFKLREEKRAPDALASEKVK